MLLRSGNPKKRIIFPTPPTTPIVSTTRPPRDEEAKLGDADINKVVTPKKTISVRAQKEEQQARQKQIEMAESVAALTQCLLATRGKVKRIRQAIIAANQDHSKFSYHCLKLHVETTIAAYMYVATNTTRYKTGFTFLTLREQSSSDSSTSILRRSTSLCEFHLLE